MQSASPDPVVASWLTACLCFCHCHSVSLQCFTFFVQCNTGHLYKYSPPSWLWLDTWLWRPLHHSDPCFVKSDSKERYFAINIKKCQCHLHRKWWLNPKKEGLSPFIDCDTWQQALSNFSETCKRLNPMCQSDRIGEIRILMENLKKPVQPVSPR